MKKLKRTYIRSAVTIGAVLILMLIAGSVFDLRISKFMYPGHESSFGQFFAAFGKMPAFVEMVCAGVLLLTVMGKIRQNLRWLATAGSAVLIVGGLLMAAGEAVEDVPAMPFWVPLLVTAFIAAICAWGLLTLTRSCPAKTVIRFVGTLIFVVVATMITFKLLKALWGRPRMNFIAGTGNEGYFAPWWKPGSALKSRLVAEGVSKNAFDSFPSGHAACAACAMLMILLPTLGKKTHGKERSLVLLGAAWTLVVAFSRIMMGAHFLSDVTVGCGITLVFSVIGIKLFYFSGRFFRWFWALIAEPQKNMQNNDNMG